MKVTGIAAALLVALLSVVSPAVSSSGATTTYNNNESPYWKRIARRLGDEPLPFFGIPRGGSNKDTAFKPSVGEHVKKETPCDKEDDYDVAERAIFEAEVKAASLLYEAEKKVFDTLFDGLEEKPLHDDVQETKQRKSSKSRVGDDEAINVVVVDNLYGQTGKPFFEAEKKAADLLCKAEQALEHAVEEEVQTFFPELHHHNNEE